MPEFAYDLHIHSCLSPCGDEDMTPANIAGMAAVKELDVIALTDHNTSRNCAPFLKMAEAYGLVGLPGMELTTNEDVHVVCLFPDLYAAMDFDTYVYNRMFKIANKEHIFGAQLLYNENDEIIGKEPNLLITNAAINFEDVFDLTEERGGIMIPAHIDNRRHSRLRHPYANAVLAKDIHCYAACMRIAQHCIGTAAGNVCPQEQHCTIII